MQNLRRKKLKTIFVIFISLGIVGVSCYAGYAMQLGTLQLEVIPYLRGGTIAWDQLEGIGGHKSIIAGGLNANITHKSTSYASTINLEKWYMSEGLDDDRGKIPKEGYDISTEVKYFLKSKGNLLIYPYAGIGFGEWDRGKIWEVWKSLKFFNWAIGGGVKNEKGYIRAEITKLFSPSTNTNLEPKPRYGFSAQSGIMLESILIGLFYKYAGVEDPDAKITQSGLFIGHRFR